MPRKVFRVPDPDEVIAKCQVSDCMAAAVGLRNFHVSPFASDPVVWVEAQRMLCAHHADVAKQQEYLIRVLRKRHARVHEDAHVDDDVMLTCSNYCEHDDVLNSYWDAVRLYNSILSYPDRVIALALLCVLDEIDNSVCIQEAVREMPPNRR